MATLARNALRESTAVARFAHLLGFPAKGAFGAPRAEDESKKDPDAAVVAEGTDDDDCPKCDGTGVDDDGEACDACDGTGEKQDEAKKGKKARKAKATDDDKEKSDEQMSDDDDEAKAATAGRAFERARCAAIFATPAAAVRPDLAAHLAFNTGMSARAAIDMLAVTAAGAPQQAPARLAARPRIDLGDGGAPAPGGAKGLASQIVAAGKKRRGEI